MASYGVNYGFLQDLGCNAVGAVRAQADSTLLTRIRSWPNRAVERVWAAYEWPHYRTELLLSVKNGDDRVWLPADFTGLWRSTGISYTSHFGYPTLTSVSLEHIETWRSAGVTKGPPQFYAFGEAASDGRIAMHFWRTADQSYTWRLFYRRRPRVMDADTDIPDLPPILHDALATATKIVAREDEDLDVSRDLSQRLQAQLAEAWARIGNINERAISTLSPTREFGPLGVEHGENRTLAPDIASQVTG